MQMFVLQMVPLLVFLVVDMIWSNTTVSIISAVLFAVVQITFSYIRTGAIDYFVFIDVALIVGLGATSIFLKNDLFFKMKPAIIELVMSGLLLALVLAPDSFLMGYLGRFMPPNTTFTPEAIPLIKKMLIAMIIYTLLHIGAVYYTALHSSRKMWAMVSGPGYFLLFIPLMIWIGVKRVRGMRRKSNIPRDRTLSELSTKQDSL